MLLRGQCVPQATKMSSRVSGRALNLPATAIKGRTRRRLGASPWTESATRTLLWERIARRCSLGLPLGKASSMESASVGGVVASPSTWLLESVQMVSAQVGPGVAQIKRVHRIRSAFQRIATLKMCVLSQTSDSSKIEWNYLPVTLRSHLKQTTS